MVRGGRLVRQPDGWLALDSTSNSIQVTCPSDTDLVVGTASGGVDLTGQLGAVRVMTNSGKIRVEGVRSADLRSSSAAVRVRSCTDDCRVVTTSGSVRVDSAGRIDVSTTSGAVTVGRSGDGEVHTVTGSVDLGATGSGTLRVHTMSSSVEIRVPAGMRPHSELRSGTGQVQNDCDQGTDGSIEVRTESGTIRISQW